MDYTEMETTGVRHALNKNIMTEATCAARPIMHDDGDGVNKDFIFLSR